MTQKIIQIGNSTGIIIPKSFLDLLSLKPGSEVIVDTDEASPAFIDSNKRTGTAAIQQRCWYIWNSTIQQFNNITLQVINQELVKTVLLIEKEKWEVEKIATWLENQTKSA